MIFDNFFNNLAYRFGYISEKEAYIKSVPKEKRKKLNRLLRTQSDIRSLSDINKYINNSKEIINIVKESKFGKGSRKKDAISLVQMNDMYGYRVGMSRLYDIFSQTPFMAYAFIARHHPDVRSCIQVILDEITNDGFTLICEKGVTRKRMKEVYRKNKRSQNTSAKIGSL